MCYSSPGAARSKSWNWGFTYPDFQYWGAGFSNYPARIGSTKGDPITRAGRTLESATKGTCVCGSCPGWGAREFSWATPFLNNGVAMRTIPPWCVIRGHWIRGWTQSARHTGPCAWNAAQRDPFGAPRPVIHFLGKRSYHDSPDRVRWDPSGLSIPSKFNCKFARGVGESGGRQILGAGGGLSANFLQDAPHALLGQRPHHRL